MESEAGTDHSEAQVMALNDHDHDESAEPTGMLADKWGDLEEDGQDKGEGARAFPGCGDAEQAVEKEGQATGAHAEGGAVQERNAESSASPKGLERGGGQGSGMSPTIGLARMPRTYAEAAKALAGGSGAHGDAQKSFFAPVAVPITVAPAKGKEKEAAVGHAANAGPKIRRRTSPAMRASSQACENEFVKIGRETCVALFRREIGSSDLHQLSVQQTFAKTYFDVKSGVLEVWDGDRMWKFALRSAAGSHSFFLRKKWGAFCSAHALKHGDSVTFCRRPSSNIGPGGMNGGAVTAGGTDRPQAQSTGSLAIKVSRATPELARELEQGLSDARALDLQANQMAVKRAKPGVEPVEKALTASDRNTSHLGVVQNMLHVFPVLPRNGGAGSTVPLTVWRGDRRYVMKFTFSISRKLHIMHGEWGELVRAARLEEGDVVRFYPNRDGSYGLAIHRRADVLLVGLRESLAADPVIEEGERGSQDAGLAVKCDTPSKAGSSKRPRIRKRTPKQRGTGRGASEAQGLHTTGEEAPAQVSEPAASAGPHAPADTDKQDVRQPYRLGPVEAGADAAPDAGAHKEFPDPYGIAYASPGWFYAGPPSPFPGGPSPTQMFTAQHQGGGMASMGVDPYSSMAAALQAAFVSTFHQTGGLVLPTTPYGMGAGAAQASLSPFANFTNLFPVEGPGQPSAANDPLDPGVVNTAWSPLPAYGPSADQRRDPSSPRLWSPRRRGSRSRPRSTPPSEKGSASGPKTTISRLAEAVAKVDESETHECETTVEELQARARAMGAAIEAAGQEIAVYTEADDAAVKGAVMEGSENIAPGTAPSVVAEKKGKSAFFRTDEPRTPFRQIQPTDRAGPP